MSGPSDLADEKRQSELSSFVMREVQRILAQCDEARQSDKADVAPWGSASDNSTAVAAEFLGRLEAEVAANIAYDIVPGSRSRPKSITCMRVASMNSVLVLLPRP